MTDTTPPSPQPVPPANRNVANSFQDAFRYFGVTLFIGILMATIFTMWTPASILPRDAAEQIEIAMATQLSSQSTTTPPTPTPSNQPLIGIVSGHLGNDAGAVCADDGLTESQINYNVATAVKQNLEQAGFRVDLLDEFDTRLNNYQAEVLVSIHADSCDYINDLATGFKVSGSLESKVPTETQRLVACLTDRYTAQTQLTFHAGSITYDMTYYHAYREIAPETPAAIIEIGFMNLDRDLLSNHPDIVARGITDGIICYIYAEPVTSN